MPRIPRADSDARFQVADMPHLVGDGWTAPGRATQQLGQAIGQVGKAFAGLGTEQDQKAEQEETFNAKLAMLEAENKFDLTEGPSRDAYMSVDTNDGRDYHERRIADWQGASNDVAFRYSSSPYPKVRQAVQLWQLRKQGQVGEHSQLFGRKLYEDKTFSKTEAALTGELGAMSTDEAAVRYKDNPEAFEADFRAGFAKSNAIINQFPFKDARADRLRKHAADLLGKALEKAPGGVSVPTVEKMIGELIQQQSVVPGPVPGVPPGSNAVPGPQTGVSDEELTKRVSAQEFFGPDVKVDSLPLGMRASNNPTNIKYTGSAYQRQNFPGLVGPSSAKDQGDPQALFANPLAGMVAGARLALTKQTAHGLDTVEKLITDPKNGWTPGYKAAAEHVASQMGVKPTDTVDLRNPETMQKFMRALITQEHGASGKLYSDDLIRRGTEVALGGAGGGRSQQGPPGKVEIGVGKFVPPTTPGVITASASQTERTTNAQGYGAQLTGSITVNGRTYEWVSGGRGRGSIPTGTYEIQRFTSGTQRASEGRSFRRDAFELNAAQDDIGRAAKEAKRDGLLIHDARAGLTAGCLGIKGDFDQFKRDLAAEQAKNGGRVAVQVGTQRQLASVSRGTEGAQVLSSTGQQATQPPADDGPARVFFDADRNYTRTEIDNLVKKHGPNIVIGGNPLNDGFKEMAAYAREKGAKVHAYKKGPGEPEFGYNGDGKVKFPQDHEEIKAKGFSVADWQKGGKWLAAEREDMLAAKKEGVEPYSVEWDNINDKKPGEIRDLLIDQTKWAKENGVTTRVVLKNLNARQWQAVNAGIEQGRIDKNLIAPFAIVEEHMADGDRQAAEAEAKRQGIAQFRTENTMRYASPADGFERPSNRIPGSANDNGRLPVHQAQMRPSVESHLVEALQKKLPALKQKRAGELQSAIKGIEEAAVEGKLPNERSLAQITQQVVDVGDKGLAARFQNAVITARMNKEYIQAPVSLMARDLSVMDAMIAQSGVTIVPKGKGTPSAEGGGESETEGLPPALALTVQRRDALKKLHDKAVEELKKDPVAWAVKAEVVSPLPPLTKETFSVDLLRQKAAQTDAIANHYGEEFRQYFSPGEKEHLKALFGQGGKPMIAMAGMMVEAYGPKAVKAIGEIAKDAPEAAHLGWLIVNKADNQTVKDLAAAVELKRFREQQKGKEVEAITAQQVSDKFHDGFKASLGFVEDKVREQVLHNAKVLYEYRVNRTGQKVTKDNVQDGVLTQVFKELLGENKVGDKTYGGIAPVEGWFSNQANVPIHLPANVKQDAFFEMMRSLRNSDFGWTIQKPDGAGGGMPEPKPDRPRTRGTENLAKLAEGVPQPEAVPPTAAVKERSEVASNVPADMRDGAEAAMRAAGALPQMAMTQIDRSGAVRGAPLDYKGRPMNWSAIASRGTFITVGEGKYKVAMGDPFSNDQQIVGSTAGGHFVIDLNDPHLQRILRERNPNAFRPY